MKRDHKEMDTAAACVYGFGMATATIEIELPEALARSLGGEKSDLPRRTLEAATAQQFAAGHLTHAEVAEILGLSRWETDAFLKVQQAFAPFDHAELSAELERLRALSK